MPFTSLEDLCRRIDLQQREPARARGADPLRQPGWARCESRHADGSAWRRRCSSATRTRARSAGRTGRHVRPGGRARERAPCSRARASCRSGARRAPGRASARRSGLYLTGHPSSASKRTCARFVSASHRRSGQRAAAVGGERRASAAARQVTRRGPDRRDHASAARAPASCSMTAPGASRSTLFEEQFQQYRDLLVKDALVLVEGKLRFDEFSNAWRMPASASALLDKLREQQARRLVLRWPDARATAPAHSSSGCSRCCAPLARRPVRGTDRVPRRPGAARAHAGRGLERAAHAAS